MEKWNLQLFAGEGDGGAAASGADGGTTGAQGAMDAASQDTTRSGLREGKGNPLASVQYGVSQGAPAPAQTGGQDDAVQTEAKEETFDELIRGRYKADFDQKVQAILSGRLKKANETQAQMDKVNAILPQLAKKYGLGENATLDEVSRKITDDDSLYEEEASRMGVSTQVVRDMHRLEAERDAAQRAQAETLEDMRLRSHFENLSRQAEALREVFPGFDLMAEINSSPDFARLTSPEVNIPVEVAYRAVHAREIESGAMQYGAQRAAAQVAASVKANAARPVENGMSNRGAAEWRTDPSKLKKADFEEIKRRLARGEEISFG